MSLATKRIHISRDVFHGYVFPFNFPSEGNTFSLTFKSGSNNDFAYTDCNSFNALVDNHRSETVTDTNLPSLSFTPTQLPSSPPSFAPQKSHPDTHFNNPITSPSSPHCTTTINLPATMQRRRSHTENKVPSHLKDYICSIPNLKPYVIHTPICTLTDPPIANISLNALFSNHHHVPPDSIRYDSQSFVKCICHIGEPSLYEEEIMSPAWKEAMKKEFKALYAKNT